MCVKKQNKTNLEYVPKLQQFVAQRLSETERVSSHLIVLSGFFFH